MKRLTTLVRGFALAGLLVPFIASSTASASGWYLTYWGDYSNNLTARVLTPEGNDSYSFSKTITNNVGNLTMWANQGNTGGNLRQVMVPENVPDYADTQSCATWVSSSAESVQEGLAFRVAQTPQGNTKAVTVTKNVIYGVHWVFNVHVWDTSNAAQPFTQVAQFDMLNAVWQNGALKPKPWRACARLVGNTISFKVWMPFQGQSEPAWTDPVYARSATIPAGWTQPGKTGWYVGHIAPGQSAHYNGLTTHALLP